MTAFKKQILLGVILVILANILAFALHQGLFSNIAWVIYGLLWIVHPHRTYDPLCDFIKSIHPRECSKRHESCKIAAFCE